MFNADQSLVYVSFSLLGELSLNGSLHCGRQSVQYVNELPVSGSIRLSTVIFELLDDVFVGQRDPRKCIKLHELYHKVSPTSACEQPGHFGVFEENETICLRIEDS